MRSDARGPEDRWIGSALTLVTIGALITVWSGVWGAYLLNDDSERSTIWGYIDVGLILTGLTFLFFGLRMGFLRRKTKEDAAEPKAEVEA